MLHLTNQMAGIFVFLFVVISIVRIDGDIIVCPESDGNCPYLAAIGKCKTNPGYMLENCRKSCGQCTDYWQNIGCKDDVAGCKQKAMNGECKSNPSYMLQNCKMSCMQCQEDCFDRLSDCWTKALNGECKTKPNTTLNMCKESCRQCGMGGCVDKESSCKDAAIAGKCATDQAVRQNCKMSCMLCHQDDCFDYGRFCPMVKNQDKCNLSSQPTYQQKCPVSCGNCATNILGCNDILVFLGDEKKSYDTDLTLSSSNIELSKKGPDGLGLLNSWVFPGSRSSYVHITGAKVNLQGGSFTFATYIHQDARQIGPLIEWGGTGCCGANFWVQNDRLYANLNPNNKGPELSQTFTKLTLGKWHFVGLSYNRESGDTVMWVDDELFVWNLKGKQVDNVGDVYIGIRPHLENWGLKAKLAGTTLMKCPLKTRDLVHTTTQQQINALRRQILSSARL